MKPLIWFAVLGTAGFDWSLCSAQAQDENAPASLGIERVAQVNEEVDDVAVSGGFAIAVSGQHVMVVDVSDARHPEVVGRCAILREEAFLSRVLVAHGFAYVGCTLGDFPFRRVIVIVDVSDPAAPRVVGSHKLPSGGPLGEMTYGSDHLYVACGGVTQFSSSVLALHLSEPTSLREVGGVGIRGIVRDVELSGNHLYVVLQPPAPFFGPGGPDFTVVDVSDPSAPATVGEHRWGSQCVAVRDDQVYLAGGTDLRVFDFSMREEPRELGSCPVPVPHRATHLILSENRAFVVSQGFLHVVDISDPDNPEEVACWRSLETVSGIAVSGRRVFVAGSGGLSILQIEEGIDGSLD